MAFCILDDGRKLTMPAEKLAMLWSIKQGEVQATPEQRLKAKQIEKFYFAPDTAPESWKRLHVRDVSAERKHWTDV